MKSCNAIPRSEVDVEVMAVHLFGRAFEGGVVADRRWIDEQLARLQTHRAGCRCQEPCHLQRVSPSRVAWIVSMWQRQYNKSQVLARR
jgi:hypothetical protein